MIARHVTTLANSVSLALSHCTIYEVNIDESLDTLDQLPCVLTACNLSNKMRHVQNKSAVIVSVATVMQLQ